MWLDHPNLFRVGGLVPGEEVVLLGSRAGQGAGPCSSDHGGLCLDVLAPRKLATAVVDSDGFASFSMTPPSSKLLDGTTVWLQAVVDRGGDSASSDVLTTTAADGLIDGDGDGAPADCDCDDFEPLAVPWGGPDVCDTIDNDCDGLVDGGQWVEPGTGRDAHTPLTPGDPVEFVNDGLLNPYLNVSGGVDGFQSIVEIQTGLTRVSDGLSLEAAGPPNYMALANYLSCSGEFWGVRVFLDTPVPPLTIDELLCSLDGEALELDLRVIDLDTSLDAATTIEVEGTLDPATAASCP